jgi:quercetin dioxygenase-like cupin family protein
VYIALQAQPEVDKRQQARLVALAPALSLTDLVKGAVEMMSINGYAYRIGALSVPPGMPVKAVRRAMRTTFVPLAAAALALGASPAIAENREQVKVVFEHALPNIEGKRMVSVVVNYPPGAKSLAHRHAASAFIYAYVLSGAIRSQVGDDPAKVYRAGEGFYETPGSPQDQ